MASVGQSQADKFYEVARDAMLLREWKSDLPNEITGIGGERVSWNPDAARGERRLQSLKGLARACLVQQGADRDKVDNMPPHALALAALGFADHHDLAAIGISASDPTYHTTGSFPNIMYDAANVIARRAYEEARTTFQLWMHQAEARDFKDVHSVTAGEASDPKAIPEDGEFEESVMTDSKESYKLTVWGHRFSLTWQTVVNDQPGAFTGQAKRHGAAMRRKQNKLAYAVLKDNPTMADGGAVFNATATTTPGGHDNLITAGGAPSVATLNAGYAKMYQKTGLSEDSSALGIEPMYLPHPPALRGTVLELLGSTANPASSSNSGVKNVWHDMLTPITEAELGAAAGGSDAAWFLAADGEMTPTLEYCYLQGMEEPTIETQRSFERLAIVHRIWQAFAVAPIDWRGIFENDGS